MKYCVRQLAVYVMCALKEIHGRQLQEAETEEMEILELAVTDWARGWAVAAQAALAERPHSASLVAEAHAMAVTDTARRHHPRSHYTHTIAKYVLVYKHAAFSNDAVNVENTLNYSESKQEQEDAKFYRALFLSHRKTSLRTRTALYKI